MERTTTKDYALLILRLAGLYLALGHGWAKVVALTTGQAGGLVQGVASLGFPAPLVFAWAAALSEFFGGLGIFLGFGTRVCAFFAGFTMFVAAFLRHRALTQLFAWLGFVSVPEETLRRLGNPERALEYLIIFLALLLLGGGRLALERRLRGRRY